MPDATHTTLREQVRDAIGGAASADDASVAAHPDFVDAAATAVLAVFAERDRVLRERIEEHPFRCPVHGMTDCSPLLNGCSIPNQVAAWALAMIHEPHIESCPACHGITEHVLGCPHMDTPQ